MSDTDGVRHLKSPIPALGVSSGAQAQSTFLQPELAERGPGRRVDQLASGAAKAHTSGVTRSQAYCWL